MKIPKGFIEVTETVHGAEYPTLIRVEDMKSVKGYRNYRSIFFVDKGRNPIDVKQTLDEIAELITG